MPAAARLGCPVIPAGPGNTEQQLQVIGAFRPIAYAGTPDFLKILLDACDAAGVSPSIKKASVGAAAFPPSLQKWVSDRGVAAYQTYGAAERRHGRLRDDGARGNGHQRGRDR